MGKLQKEPSSMTIALVPGEPVELSVGGRSGLNITFTSPGVVYGSSTPNGVRTILAATVEDSETVFVGEDIPRYIVTDDEGVTVTTAVSSNGSIVETGGGTAVAPSDPVLGEVDTGRVTVDGEAIFRFTFEGQDTLSIPFNGPYPDLSGIMRVTNHGLVLVNETTQVQIHTGFDNGSSAFNWFVDASGRLQLSNVSVNTGAGNQQTLWGFIEYTRQ